jgi:hypothetical protein
MPTLWPRRVAPCSPYGLVEVPITKNLLVKGHLLVSSWNDMNGFSGQGSQIVQVDPVSGATTVFATLPATLVRAPMQLDDCGAAAWA